MPYCPSHEQVDSLEPASKCGVLALAAPSLDSTATQMLQKEGFSLVCPELVWVILHSPAPLSDSTSTNG